MENRVQIPTLSFDSTSKQWLALEDTKAEDTDLDNINKLTFLTYNVWFDAHNFMERGIELRNFMETSNADFICLQEVIKEFHSDLLNTPWVQGYYVSGNTIKGYTTLILSKHPCKFYEKKLSTKMGRSLLYAELKINGMLAVIGTVHLESLGNAALRKAQLGSSLEEFKPYRMAFLMGDFDFDNKTEDKTITSDYVDLWKNLHPKDPGYTMKATPRYKPWRPDKILMKRTKLCKGIAIERIGMNPLPKYKGTEIKKIKDWRGEEEEEIATPSDHYGLIGVVGIQQQGDGTLEEDNQDDKALIKLGKFRNLLLYFVPIIFVLFYYLFGKI